MLIFKQKEIKGNKAFCTPACFLNISLRRVCFRWLRGCSNRVTDISVLSVVFAGLLGMAWATYSSNCGISHWGRNAGPVKLSGIESIFDPQNQLEPLYFSWNIFLLFRLRIWDAWCSRGSEISFDAWGTHLWTKPEGRTGHQVQDSCLWFHT